MGRARVWLRITAVVATLFVAAVQIVATNSADGRATDTAGTDADHLAHGRLPRSAIVTSPPIYEPGAVYEITTRSSSRETVATLHRGCGRHAQDHVALGPANVLQQYFTPTDESPTTTVYSADVEIRKGHHSPARSE